MHDLPHDDQAEQSVLGAMITSRDAVIDAVDTVNPEDFYQPRHQIIFAAIRDMFIEGVDVDATTLSSWMGQRGELDHAGGLPYLFTLIETVPYVRNVSRYADTVVEKATLRRAVDAGVRIQQAAMSADLSADDVVEMAQTTTSGLARAEVSDMAQVSDLLISTMDDLDDVANGGVGAGIPTGFHDLDELTNGLKGGQMIIVAARPGVGKTTIGLDFMRNASLRHGKTSAIFSLEMSKSEIVQRILSAESNVKLATMRAGKLSDEEWSQLGNTGGAISDAKMFIDDSPGLTMVSIRSKARQLKQRHGLDLVVVDYLQLMSSGQRVESRQQEVSDFSRQLKLLAKELDVPVIAVSQLNRGPESRDDKRPQLSDLRESGSLEQDADMVMLLYRPDSQDPDHARAGEADIILAKHRGGPIGDIKIAHQLHLSRFANLARQV